MLRLSVFSDRRNFRRAGMLKKIERTSTCVPGASPPSRTMSILPPLTTISVPASACRSRVVRRKRDTLAMLGSLSRSLGSLDRVSCWLMVSSLVNADPGHVQ